MNSLRHTEGKNEAAAATKQFEFCSGAVGPQFPEIDQEPFNLTDEELAQACREGKA